MVNWADFGGVFNTLKELDVGVIEAESRAEVVIVCLGARTATAQVSAWLHDASYQRYGPVGVDPLHLGTLPVQLPADLLARASLIVVALDAAHPLSRAESESLQSVLRLGMPLLVVALGASGVPPAFDLPGHMRVQPVADRLALATAIAEMLPRELHLSAARRLTGLREAVAERLVQGTSVANASYALAAGLPQQIPILSVPFAAADMLVLTKNQALMVYKLALAYGSTSDFPTHLREIVPVLGGAYVWRELARSLTGLIPIWGLVPKTAVAFAGTFTTGMVARNWYATGALLDQKRLKELSGEAMSLARNWTDEALVVAKREGNGLYGRWDRFWAWMRSKLPWYKRKTN